MDWQQSVSLEALLRGGASADEIVKATGLPVGSSFGPMDNIEDLAIAGAYDMAEIRVVLPNDITISISHGANGR